MKKYVVRGKEIAYHDANYTKGNIVKNDGVWLRMPTTQLFPNMLLYPTNYKFLW